MVPSISFSNALLATLLPLQTCLVFLMNFNKIWSGDSFYAESLRLFYVRQLQLARGRILYPTELGALSLASFSYQSFFSIKACYLILNRRVFVAISHLIIVATFFYYQSISKAALISAIYLCSTVFYFNQIERGNYQFLGLGVSIASVAIFILESWAPHFIISLVLTCILSISSFVILVIALAIYLFVQNQFFDLLILTLTGVSIAFTFLAWNTIRLSLVDKNISIESIRVSVFRVLSAVGFIPTESTIGDGKILEKDFSLARRRNYFKACIAVFPPLLGLTLPLHSSLISVLLVLIIILFLNQAKMLRLFDYHFIYTWIYTFLVLTVQDINFYSVAVLILIGSNPIFVYAMDNYNKNINRGFVLRVPILVSESKRSEILDALERPLNITSAFIMPHDRNIECYDDLWKHESLALEWLWTALQQRHIKFFPDWFSVFYSEQGIKHLKLLLADGEVNHDVIIFASSNTSDRGLFSIRDTFGYDISDRYFSIISNSVATLKLSN